MNREILLKLKKDNRNNPVIYNLINVIIGECDRIDKNLSSELFISVVNKMYKDNNKSLCLIDKHSEKGVILTSENEFLLTFIPTPLDDQELREIVNTSILFGAECIGDIMKYFKEKYSGRYNGSTLSKIAKEILQEYGKS